MKTFLDWLKDESREDIIDLVQEPNIDALDSEETTEENTRRTGYSNNYPDAYVRSQYPHKYFNPTKSDADYYKDAKPRKG